MYLVLNLRVVAKLQQEKKRPVMPPQVWNNKRIKGILTQLHQYSAKECISHSDLMVESASSENKNIYIYIFNQCSSIKWIDRSTKYVLPRIQVFIHIFPYF